MTNTPRTWEADFKEDFDWLDCGNFTPSPTDRVTRPCITCGFKTQFCLNCGRDHHVENRDTAIIARIRTIEDEAVRRERERIREIVEFERVHFWGTPELEKQTNINNMVVDNILQALTPTKTDKQ